MMRFRGDLRRPLAALAALAGIVLAGCGSSAGSGRGAGAHGPVAVLYAASLERLMNASIGPAFERATGGRFVGFPGGSDELASEIKGGVRRADVFISASPKVNAKLEGARNGNWVSWYAPFASSRLVLGYNPHSRFAAQLRQRPWYRVIAEPGLRLGFTDPRLDPKGKLAVAALERAARLYREPALMRIAHDPADVFPEQDLVGRLQSGQLDAGFFYTVEATASGIPTVPIAPIDEQATFTITIPRGAPDQRTAIAFVRFLLGPAGRARLRAGGLAVDRAPAAVGRGVPATLAGTIKLSR